MNCTRTIAVQLIPINTASLNLKMRLKWLVRWSWFNKSYICTHLCIESLKHHNIIIINCNNKITKVITL